MSETVHYLTISGDTEQPGLMCQYKLRNIFKSVYTFIYEALCVCVSTRVT